MKPFLLRLWAIIVVTARRLVAQPGLTLATLAGLVLAFALTMAIPLYADAVYYRTFSASVEAAEDVDAPRPPFALMYYYGGGLSAAVQYEDIAAADQYLSTSAEAVLGLPQRLLVRHVRTDGYGLFPAGEAAFDGSRALTTVRFGYVSDLAAHSTLLEGRFPEEIVVEAGEDGSPAPVIPPGPVEVAMSETLAFQLGVQVGETYTVYVQDETADGVTVARQIPVMVTGIWSPADPLEEYWFIRPTFLNEQLLMPQANFTYLIAPPLPDEVFAAIWYLVMDGSAVHYSQAAALVERINAMQQEVTERLPETRLAVSPVEDLTLYQNAANLLSVLLYAFGVPVLSLLLLFVALTTTLAVEGRRNEIAVLRSRGALTLQMLGVAALEGLLLGLAALAAAAPASLATARLMGQTRAFLDFTGRSDLRLILTGSMLLAGGGTVLLALLAQALPTWGAARQTIVTYKQQRARLLRRPWWQRFWLDALLFVPAAYGTYLLQRQGRLSVSRTASANPFENPLLFLVPALGILALTLFFLRLMPLLMRLITWVVARTRSVGLLMAARHLARTPGFYSAPLLLLVLTLSLSAFTASLAGTLDRQVIEQAYYRVGADIAFFDFGEEGSDTPTLGSILQSSSLSGGTTESATPTWRFLPLTDYLDHPGVSAATRVGEFKANSSLGAITQRGRFLGIDRYEFPQVAFWRDDFADQSLGGLMNALAVTPDGLLVPHSLMEQHGLEVGDGVRLRISLYSQNVDVDFIIAGSFDLFPTWYPDEEALFVGNLDYLFEQVGTRFPYFVWLRADPALGPDAFNIASLNWDAAAPRIEAEQRLPQRQGLLGLLSVGFVAAAGLTVLGFLLYVLFSFRRRLVEMGVLRAVGLSAGQMVRFLTWELAFLILLGGAVGTGLGVLVSRLYIPFLQVGEGAASVPPFIVEIAWPAILRIYALFGLLFVVALAALVILLRRMKLFQAIKLGETV